MMTVARSQPKLHACYGIEILFSLMDNVVPSFTQGDTVGARAKIPG